MANNPGNRQDPLPAFCFKVQINFTKNAGSVDAFFKSVGGIRFETEVVPVREGGANDTTFQLIGARKWSNLVLKKGFTGSSRLLDWCQAWLTVGEPGAQVSRAPSVTILQLNSALVTVASWEFKNAWPVKWEISELDASKSELSIETLELAHEGLRKLK
jgi:phage tail-like protein